MGSNHEKNGGRKSRDTLPSISKRFMTERFSKVGMKLKGLKYAQSKKPRNILKWN